MKPNRDEPFLLESWQDFVDEYFEKD